MQPETLLQSMVRFSTRTPMEVAALPISMIAVFGGKEVPAWMTVPLKPGSPRPEPSSWLLVGTTIVASVIQVPRPSVTFTDLLPILVKGSAVNFSGKLSMIQQVCGQDSTAAASDLCLTPSTIRMPFTLEKLQELMSLHACANALGARIRNA